MDRNYRITLACQNYDRTHAVIHGLIKANGIDLQVVEMNNAGKMTTGMFNGEYDVSEFSFAEHVYYTSRNRSSLVGIPVFPLRMFRHGFIFCNTSSNITDPKYLEGKKVGLYRLAQTACVWIRGLLVDEHGVSPKGTGWYVPSRHPIHNWDDGSEADQVEPGDGSIIRYLEMREQHDNQGVVDTALCEGEIDALCSAVPPRSFLKGDKRIKRLVENYKRVEVSYFKKTGIFPIMHVLVAKKSVVEEHPDLPGKLFALFSESKKLAMRQLRAEGSLSLAWKDHYVDEEEEILQADGWAYGLGKNRHVINKFLSYCYELGVANREMRPEELFAPSTWDLRE